MEGLPVSVPPSPFVQARALTIVNRGPRVLGMVALSVPRYWLHEATWALWNVFVRWPVSWIVPENELVARMFFDIYTQPKKQNLLGVPVLMPQQLDIQALQYRGLLRMTALHYIRNCFWKHGDGMSAFWQPPRNCQATLSTVYVNEPKKWPVEKLPIGPMRTVRKQCFAFLEMCGPSQEPTACQAYDIRPCLGDNLSGNQDAWKPLVSISTASHCKCANFLPNQLQILSIELSTGFTTVEKSFQVDTRNLVFQSNTVLEKNGSFMTLARDRFFNKNRQHIVLFDVRGNFLSTHSFFSSMDSNEQMSLCEKNTDTFLIAQKNLQGLFLVAERSWSFLMDCIQQDNPKITVTVQV